MHTNKNMVIHSFFIFQVYGLNNLQNLIKFLLYYKNIVQENIHI